MSSSTTKKQALIMMHLSVLIWGFTGVLGRGITLQEGPLVWWRMFLVVVFMAFVFAFRKQPMKVDKKTLWQMFGIGNIIMVHWLLFYAAIKYSNVSITLSCFASTALFTALLEPLLMKKRFYAEEIVFSLIAMLGIWIIYADGSIYLTGIILALLSAFVGSFFNIFNKPVVEKTDPQIVTFYEMASGLIGLTLLLPLYEKFLPVSSFMPTPNDWWLLLFLAIICTYVTILLSLKALQHLSAFTLNLSINLEPVYGIALAFFFFEENELLNTGFYIGSGIIMFSVVAHSWWTLRRGKRNSNHMSNTKD
jgi:drug/metabolite transporter (DMT)-like permease